jgi:hypothetical protein
LTRHALGHYRSFQTTFFIMVPAAAAEAAADDRAWARWMDAPVGSVGIDRAVIGVVWWEVGGAERVPPMLSL